MRPPTQTASGTVARREAHDGLGHQADPFRVGVRAAGMRFRFRRGRQSLSVACTRPRTGTARKGFGVCGADPHAVESRQCFGRWPEAVQGSVAGAGGLSVVLTVDEREVRLCVVDDGRGMGDGSSGGGGHGLRNMRARADALRELTLVAPHGTSLTWCVPI
jgi:hypothetical protein